MKEEGKIRFKEIILMGIFSTIIMDIGYVLIKVTGIVDPSMETFHLGRWLLHMLQGTFVHTDIRAAEALMLEKPVSLMSHYQAGIILGAVFLKLRKRFSLFSSSKLMGLVFGWITIVLPWLVMYPAMGFGILGLDCPENTNYVLFSILNHSAYGLGITLWLVWLRDRFIKEA